MHGQTPALRSPVGAKEVSPARKGWDCVTNLPEHRRCGTTGDRIAFKISPIRSLTKVLTNKYLYATVGRFCCSRPIRWGRSTLELPRSGRKRAVSVMTHYEVRKIEAGASRAPHSVQPRASGFQNSNRNKPGNRNARNSPFICDLNFSNRNKIGGVAKTKSEGFANIPKVLVASLPASEGSPNIEPLTSNLCTILIATPPNRNALNSPDVNKTCRSNRNNRKGSRGPGEGRTGEITGASASFSERRNRS